MNNPIYPCLWFDGQAKAAADFYSNVFGDSVITSESTMVVTFELSGQKFMGLNGGPQFKPTAAISFMVTIENEEELEGVWNQLIDGGFVFMPLDKYDWSEKYGWVQDKFGISWQLIFGKLSDVHGQKFVPTLMFCGESQGKAEEAIHFYLSSFKSSSLEGILKYDSGEMKGQVNHAQFKLNSIVFAAMDSGVPQPFTFTEGISLVVDCDTQEEIDHYWEKLTDGGEESMCGWLKDRFGVSWQVVPTVLGDLMSDPSQAEKVMQAFLKMKKFDIEILKQA